MLLLRDWKSMYTLMATDNMSLGRTLMDSFLPISKISGTTGSCTAKYYPVGLMSTIENKKSGLTIQLSPVSEIPMKKH